MREHVFRNPRIWTIAIADFFVYTVRFAALDWGIVLLMETKGLTLTQATTLCFVFEIVGGNCGMVVAGWATDRFFGSRAHRTSVFCNRRRRHVAFHLVCAGGIRPCARFAHVHGLMTVRKDLMR